MPPKKQTKDNNALKQQENENVDVKSLPILNDFIFTTQHSFKYRQNKQMMDQCMIAEFDLSSLAASNDPDVVEQAKRNKVIQSPELMERAKTANYLSLEELAQPDTINPVKMQSTLARCTLDILFQIQTGLRREKLLVQNDYQSKIAAATESDKASIKSSYKDKMSEIELIVWLKDFPKTESDLKELQAQSLQHYPQYDLYIHAGIIIEEQYRIDYDFLEEPPSNNGREMSQEEQEEEIQLKLKQEKEEFNQETRFNASNDLFQMNQFAMNCPQQSQMRHFIPHRVKFFGPDPPPALPEPAPVQEPEVVDTKKLKKGEVLPPPEIIKTPELIAYEKVFLKFTKQFRKTVDQLSQDLQEYRQLVSENIKKVPLYPKYTAEEMKKFFEEEEKYKQYLQLKESTQSLRASSQTISAKGVKQPTPQPNSRTNTPMEETKPEPKINISLDEQPKNWDFCHYERVVKEMKPENTSVGSILAAMIYQIEKANDHKSNLVSDSWMSQELDAMLSTLTNSKHQTGGFKPCQQIFDKNDEILSRKGQFIFQNGMDQTEYEDQILDKLEIPGVNGRFKMPQTVQKSLAQLKTQNNQVMCKSIPQSQSKRVLVLEQFSKLLTQNNPERTYNFQDRNYKEFYNLNSFKQIFATLVRTYPDINTQYFENDDALLLALNYKNPKGRILRKQWTYPLKVIPSYQDWLIVNNDQSIPQEVYDLPNCGILRQKQKFCYPYDQSIIRIQKNFVGNRVFGSNVILKDNLIFGVKEAQKKLDTKVANQDQILNNETKKQSDLRCEFWLEFENQTKMHVEMCDRAEVSNQIPNVQEIPERQGEYAASKGSCLTLTYKEGIVVQILPNGNIRQTNFNGDVMTRTFTREGAVITEQKNGNKLIYLSDGTITYADVRRGVWQTITPQGKQRLRNLRTGKVEDLPQIIEGHEQIDPQTRAKTFVRQDGLMKIEYSDLRTILQFPDHTQILITKSGADEEESKTTTKLFTCSGFCPVQLTYDPVKARAGTIISKGGADALMGTDGIMERSFGGLLTEIFLPDRSTVQTYLEKQELPGYNNFSTSLVHLICRDDFSRIKVRQDGEIVVISANARSYLNHIGQKKEFGTKDSDFFFELFGVPNERRTGVYTCNLERGRIWTKDEEGNHFIIYANGESVEKLSVTFNLDQMVEGIDNREPTSPRIRDGLFIEEENNFLPPPLNVGEPRLFYVSSKGVDEFFNKSQMEYKLRCLEKDAQITKTYSQVKLNGENVQTQDFLKQIKEFDPLKPSTLSHVKYPPMPECLGFVNQTVNIASEPERVNFIRQKIFKYGAMSTQDFDQCIQSWSKAQAQNQKIESDRRNFKIQQNFTEDFIKNQTRLYLRMAKQRGIDLKNLVGEEYQEVKKQSADKNRKELMEQLENFECA